MLTFKQHDTISTQKTPAHYLALDRGKIYLSNPKDWMYTVTLTTEFLIANLNKEDTFLALPYEPLYYFLTNKTSPTWHVLLTEAVRFTTQQEEKMIRSLEDKKVKYVILSNRYISAEPGLGHLGQTHLKELYKYIVNHFETVKTLGHWNAPPGWVTNHSITIMKRK